MSVVARPEPRHRWTWLNDQPIASRSAWGLRGCASAVPSSAPARAGQADGHELPHRPGTA
jgi:hypothetical protein